MFLGLADFGDLPALLATARLEAGGYTVQTTHYATGPIAVEALTRGDGDFAHGSTRSYWAATAQGAGLRMIMEHTGNLHRLVVPTSMASCADLAGKPLALQGEAAAGTALVRAYLARECPTARPQELIVPESENRAAALLSGTVGGAVLWLDTFLRLEHLAPGRFKVLCDFSREWPGVLTTGVYVNGAFAAAHPDVVRDYVRARVRAHRDVAANPAMLLDEASRRFGPKPYWTDVVDAYRKLNVWDPNCGLTRADLDRTREFFARYSNLDARLDMDAAVDLSFLDDVLKELGRVDKTDRDRR